MCNDFHYCSCVCNKLNVASVSPSSLQFLILVEIFLPHNVQNFKIEQYTEYIVFKILNMYDFNTISSWHGEKLKFLCLKMFEKMQFNHKISNYIINTVSYSTIKDIPLCREFFVKIITRRSHCVLLFILISTFKIS